MRLLQALRASQGLAALGLSFERDPTGGISVASKSRALGLWRYADDAFEFALSAPARTERTVSTV